MQLGALLKGTANGRGRVDSLAEHHHQAEGVELLLEDFVDDVPGGVVDEHRAREPELGDLGKVCLCASQDM